MIVYDLHCRQQHTFEGWFDSGDAYADQRARGLVRCPVCDDPEVEKRLSSRVQVSRGAAPASPDENAAPAAKAPVAAAKVDALAGFPPELLQKLREAVLATEDVGGRFAEEARKIHYEEVPARPIRGQATREEAAELAEEGVDFATLPDLLTRDSH